MSVDENKAVMERLVEDLDNFKLDALEDSLSPEIARDWREFLEDFPFSEHHIKITDMVAEGDRVAIRVETSGVHSGEWEGVPATGKRWTNRGMLFARLDGGKIVALEDLWDELGHLKQLGASITPPASGA
jgi:predicted ester cyclase